jgi:hypothetical protein
VSTCSDRNRPGVPEQTVRFYRSATTWLKIDDEAGSFSLFLDMAWLDSSRLSNPCQENKAKMKLYFSHATLTLLEREKDLTPPEPWVSE